MIWWVFLVFGRVKGYWVFCHDVMWSVYRDWVIGWREGGISEGREGKERRMGEGKGREGRGNGWRERKVEWMVKWEVNIFLRYLGILSYFFVLVLLVIVVIIIIIIIIIITTTIIIIIMTFCYNYSYYITTTTTIFSSTTIKKTLFSPLTSYSSHYFLTIHKNTTSDHTWPSLINN